jgi:hypothetical protein
MDVWEDHENQKSDYHWPQPLIGMGGQVITRVLGDIPKREAIDAILKEFRMQ